MVLIIAPSVLMDLCPAEESFDKMHFLQTQCHVDMTGRRWILRGKMLKYFPLGVFQSDSLICEAYGKLGPNSAQLFRLFNEKRLGSFWERDESELLSL